MTPGLLPARLLEDSGLVRAAFTTRQGGASRGRYASFNLAPGVGDAAQTVGENRRRLADMVEAPLAHLVEAQQVHGGAVAVVGAGAKGTVVPVADALVTSSPGIWLAVYTADCVPVLILDRGGPAVAAVHAGWRGLAAGIVPETFRRMREAFGTLPNRCAVALGPAIGGCCYEVDAPVAWAMKGEACWAAAARVTGPGRWRFDLRKAIRHQLTRLGVRSEDLESAPDCTRCRSDLFFSYRRDRVTGRMAACIRLCE